MHAQRPSMGKLLYPDWRRRMAKTYAIVGTGGRARMFYEAILGPHREHSRLVALCDTNQVRMDYTNLIISEELAGQPVPTYKAADFAIMLAETRPDKVIVTSIDRTHHKYIIAALEAGCDVITEKPMTTDPEKCQAILDAVERTGRSVQVTFNYRYAPHNSALRELIAEGAIGTPTSVHFEWLLDTRHGADYFRRWHRDKRNSGGLMVHKSTHHFDLVNFWLGSQPDTVFAMGDLKFYGRANAEERGVFTPYTRTTGVEAARDDHFAIDLTSSPAQKGLYWDAEKEDGYQRDQNVFGDGISIEDTMNVMVRYRNKAVMTYSLHAYAPWEGFNVAINGTGGRLELMVRETPTSMPVPPRLPKARPRASTSITSRCMANRAWSTSRRAKADMAAATRSCSRKSSAMPRPSRAMAPITAMARCRS
jgi:predicted dehydrogenase